jgi:hypothetical protein
MRGEVPQKSVCLIGLIRSATYGGNFFLPLLPPCTSHLTARMLPPAGRCRAGRFQQASPNSSQPPAPRRAAPRSPPAVSAAPRREQRRESEMGAGHRPVPGPLNRHHSRIIGKHTGWARTKQRIRRVMGMGVHSASTSPCRGFAASTPTLFLTSMMRSLICQTTHKTYPGE